MSELKTNLEQILQEKTTKLIPENIKRKVEIFDVVGTDGDAEVEELQAKIAETRQEIADTRRDLENSAATVTETGENITLNQTAEATLKKLGIGGNTEQNQYTGKNLLDISQLDETVQGIRFKGNDNNELTISGTYTGSANYISFPYKAINLPAGTYTFTSDSNNTPSGVTLRLWTIPTNLNLLDSESGTTQEDLTSFTFSLIGISNGVTYSITYKIQLENGNTKTEYEPYVRSELRVHHHLIHKL